MNKTLYSKLVDLKKRYIKNVLVPRSIGKYIDAFFNEFHNVIIQSEDKTRDIIIKSKDITRDALIKSRDLTIDNLIVTKDITRDALIKSKDVTKDALIKSRDLTIDNLIVTKDITKDALIRSKDILKDSVADSKEIAKGAVNSTKNLIPGETLPFYYRLIFPVLVIFNMFVFFYTLIRLLPYSIDEASDKKAVKSMNKIIANSENVKNRINKYYNLPSVIINPPVAIQQKTVNKIGKFWLSVNRLTPEKRVDVQINTFKRLSNERLIIVGGYDDNTRLLAGELFKNCPSNVSFVGGVDNQTLESLYINCKGLLTTSIDEDFGMNVVEAMSFGKPSIAPNEGGYKETILNNITGILIDDIDTNKIIDAIQTINKNLDLNKDNYFIPCLDQANKFNESNFTLKIRKELPQ